MKFQKTINIWADGVQDAILDGTLKLQPGQWVKCGSTGNPARFAGVSTGGTLYVQHDQGNGADNFTRFMQLRTILTTGR